MRLPLLAVLTVAFALGQQAKADTMYGYSLGVSLQNTVVPGSVVSINAVLLNTGSLPIVFASSSQEGSSIFAGVNADGQWSILDNGFSFGDFAGQFAGVTVAPGQTFEFSMGTFLAPTDQPLGTSAMPGLNFGIDFTDSITGNLLGVCPGACDYNNQAHPTYTLGTVPSSSAVTFFQAVVVDKTAIPVPEPFSWELLMLAAIALAGPLRRLHSRA
jgi:hypothetical protein